MTEAEATLTAGSSAARQLGNDSARQAATIFLGRVKGVRGELGAAAETFRSVVEERPQTIVTGIAHLDLAMLNYEWNDLAAAEASLRSAEGIVARSEHAEFRMMAGLIRARLLQRARRLEGGARVRAGHRT